MSQYKVDLENIPTAEQYKINMRDIMQNALCSEKINKLEDNISGESINMNKIEEMFLELYNNENISIGAHGTGVLPDEDQKLAKDICEKGLMCRYYDIRRTVAFQDRGMIHAHGNTTLSQLEHYDFGKETIGYVYEEKIEGKTHYYIPKKINLEQCTFIVAIPEEMKTTDDEIFCSTKRKFDRGYAKDEEDLRVGKYTNLMGRAIDPKYIVGYYMNGDISSFKCNRKFYGFKESEEEIDIPELDLEKIREENEKIKQRNIEKKTKSTEELGKETIQEQERTGSKRKILNLLTKLRNLIKNKER